MCGWDGIRLETCACAYACTHVLLGCGGDLHLERDKLRLQQLLLLHGRRRLHCHRRRRQSCHLQWDAAHRRRRVRLQLVRRLVRSGRHQRRVLQLSCLVPLLPQKLGLRASSIVGKPKPLVNCGPTVWAGSWQGSSSKPCSLVTWSIQQKVHRIMPSTHGNGSVWGFRAQRIPSTANASVVLDPQVQGNGTAS